jgi:2-(1,2-epoxy-1,2-dihydrophenyl)acetyl-CoA isomerase
MERLCETPILSLPAGARLTSADHGGLVDHKHFPQLLVDRIKYCGMESNQESGMQYTNILFDISNGVARLTLNRPDRLNSFNVAMHNEVRHAIEIVKADRAVRVLVISGAGRGFCAGQDLAERNATPGQVPADLGASVEKYYGPLVIALKHLPVPVICAVNGVAAGAGANLALAGDLVIAARSASFIESFSKLGLIPDTGGTFILPRLIGMARAKGLALLGEKLSAERAESWGLIWKCVDDADFPGEIDRLASHFANGPTLGLARTKQALNASGANTLEQQLDLERDMMRELGASDDYREGVAAFLEKRVAHFHGR